MRREAGAILGLPFPTKFLASPAKTLGGFGLVMVRLTIPYHASDLSLGRPCETFTNPYHRTEDITPSTDTMCYVGL